MFLKTWMLGYDTTLIAAKAGVHILKYKFNGSTIAIASEALQIGDSIAFNISQMIPDYLYNAIIEDPDGDTVEIADDVLTYDCLQFNPKLTLIYN
jgi:hypothetical protein